LPLALRFFELAPVLVSGTTASVLCCSRGQFPCPPPSLSRLGRFRLAPHDPLTSSSFLPPSPRFRPPCVRDPHRALFALRFPGGDPGLLDSASECLSPSCLVVFSANSFFDVTVSGQQFPVSLSSFLYRGDGLLLLFTLFALSFPLVLVLWPLRCCWYRIAGWFFIPLLFDFLLSRFLPPLCSLQTAPNFKSPVFFFSDPPSKFVIFSRLQLTVTTLVFFEALSH